MGYWIAVVDDDVISLTIARNLFKSENMRVTCLRSGADLLKFLEKNTPDLILLDIMMPEMDGFETYQLLRENGKKMAKPEIPVIFLTGESDSHTEQKGLKLGASDYIRKPFDKDILIPRIEKTIKNSRTLGDLTEEAMFDKLTGFLNKSHGTEKVNKLCQRKNGALMIMDLDNFKLVNDLYGHDMGDRVLREFADTVRNNIRETDTISRIGGDEFLAFYEGLNDEENVAFITLRINKEFCERTARLLGEDNGIPLGISVGVVMVDGQSPDYEELFEQADNALYSTKRNGKHGYSVYRQSVESDEIEGEEPRQKFDRIMKIMGERNDSGEALLLGRDSFTLIYRFLKRLYRTREGSTALVLFTLSVDKDGDNSALPNACTQFLGLLQKTLRPSDVIMQNGVNSFLVMLVERDRAEAEDCINKVRTGWEEMKESEEVNIGEVFDYI
ncbi:MAG: diguanylate cyclase [Lachnospiraceae bacterium]|nr:diguanylate cyclase [Lachnospiraceae bacterium]